jgi:hypothetical protein
VISCLWYRALLCDSLIAAHQIPMLREHFADALGAAGWPDGACLFLSGRHTGGQGQAKMTALIPTPSFSRLPRSRQCRT